MAFIKNNFTLTTDHGSKDIPSQFAYASTDDINTITSVGYFNKVGKILKTNDIIVVTGNTDGITDGTEENDNPTVSSKTLNILTVNVSNTNTVTVALNMSIGGGGGTPSSSS